jgi:hypothetical protein
MIVTKEQVEQAFEVGGFTINERFEECGYVYFPDGKELRGQDGREYPHQGRVLFSFTRHEYPDTPEGLLEEQMDKAFGACRDSGSVSPSWGRPTDRQMDQINAALKLWVIFSRQQRGTWNYSIADRALMEEAEELEEAFDG